MVLSLWLIRELATNCILLFAVQIFATDLGYLHMGMLIKKQRFHKLQSYSVCLQAMNRSLTQIAYFFAWLKAEFVTGSFSTVDL